MMSEAQTKELRDLIIRVFGVKYNLSNDELKEILLSIPELAPLNKEDHKNINGWITASSIMIEARTRVTWRDSELKTMDKLKKMESKVQ